MTAPPINVKIPDYIELVDSIDKTTSSQSSIIQPSSSDTIESQLLHLSHDLKSSQKTPNMTATLQDKTMDDADQQNAHTSLPDSISRPLPAVNEELGQKPPYYNERNQLGDIEENKTMSVGIRAAGKRPSYVEVPSIQRSAEMNFYSDLNSVVDNYDLLAPIQSLPVPNVNNAQSQHNANAASKKCLIISVFCILVALLSVQAATLIAVFVARDQIVHGIDTRLSSLRKQQDEVNAKVLDTVQSMLSRNDKASDLTVVNADSCYCLYRKQLSWKGARDFCLAKGNGVHLAEIYKRVENDFLMPILQASATNQGIWLGGSDLDKEGEWVWNYTGKPIEIFQPSQWLPNQPSSTNNLGGKEDCLDVYNWNFPTFKWNDNACDDVQPFLCKSTFFQSRCFC